MLHLPWFKLKGMVFLPASKVGWLISVCAVAYSVYVFFDIDRGSHSNIDTMTNFAYYLIFILAAYNVIAFFTCRPVESE
jgi:hypothetical protein